MSRLEGAAVKLRSALATFRNHTLERLPGSEQARGAHEYSSVPPPDSPFPTSFVDRHGYEAVCGNYLAALGIRQRKMALNELPPPGMVLAVYSPLQTEGIADFFKQVNLFFLMQISLEYDGQYVLRAYNHKAHVGRVHVMHVISRPRWQQALPPPGQMATLLCTSSGLLLSRTSLRHFKVLD